MKPVSFHIPRIEREVFRVQHEKLPYFYDRFHLHNELQFTVIVSGDGTLVAGDYVGRFKAGDVFVIGGQMPHVFRCDGINHESSASAESISVFFDESYAGTSFWETRELSATRAWLNHSGQGFRVGGLTAVRAGELLQEMVRQQGMEKLIMGFMLLQLVSESLELEVLSLQQGKDFSREILGDRMNRIMNFTFQESHRPITVREVASLVSLTTSAFCRFFKLRTGKTYFTFLNEIRVAHACRLLINTDQPIGEICYDVGFNNLSHFNACFRKKKDVSPGVYRRSFGQRRQSNYN